MRSFGIRKRTGLEEAAVDMAPLIDMTFLLLIFFLVNTNFIKETGIEVKRPEAASGSEKKGDLILIGVSSAGTIHISGKRVDLSAVRPTVSQMRLKTPKAPVIVVADESARISLVVRVIDECKLAGAGEVSLATKTEGAGA
jgi:biopolymer transport protein ExbD